MTVSRVQGGGGVQAEKLLVPKSPELSEAGVGVPKPLKLSEAGVRVPELP